MSTKNQQKLIEQARKNITDATTNLAESREAIELITLTKGYKSIFRLKDEDWSKFSKMNISMRSAFEKSIQTESIIDLLKLQFGD
jgi:hypothetical protein